MVDGFEHQKLEQVSNCEQGPNAFDIIEIGVKGGVDLGSGIERFSTF